MTLEQIKKENPIFEKKYGVNQADVEMVNQYITAIENSRNGNSPMIGDILIFTDSYGTYYTKAHIESIGNGTAEICEQPYVPFVRINNDGSIGCNTSGGAWKELPVNEFQFVRTEKKLFRNFGHCDGWKQGAVCFEATVNVWEYMEEQNFPFTTKTHDRTFISKSRLSHDNKYKYSSFLTSTAWETDLDLQAWLHTFRGKIFSNQTGQAIAWTWKEKRHSVSPEEFEKLDGIEDTLQHNGIRKCKRIYDEENCIVNTYFVWYWEDDSISDYSERYALQNKLRDELYLLPYTEKPNNHARKQIIAGTIIPINLDLFKKERN